MKNSPESAPLVSRANSSDRPLGENKAPTSMSAPLTSGPSFDRGAHPVSVRRVSYRSPSAMMIIRDPSDAGSGSYSSPDVFTAAPRCPLPGSIGPRAPDVGPSEPAGPVRSEIQPAVGAGPREPLGAGGV